MTTTPTKNESLPELPAADDPIVQMRMVVQTAREHDSLISRTWVSGWADQWEKERAATLTREAPTEGVSDALRELLHAVCGETGFAEAVRSHSGLAYPWPALDIAEEKARAALAVTPPAPQRQSSNPSGLSSESDTLSSELRLEQGEDKPVAWWNGIKEDKLERSPYGPSIRWGADAENDGHDIPLYAGMNPVHYTTQPPHQDRGEVEWQAIKLLAAACCVSPAVIECNAATDDVSMRIALRAITAALTEAKQQGPGEASDEDIAAWLERHDLDHAIRGTDARAAFEDAQTFHMTKEAPQVEAKRQTGEDHG